MLQTHTTIYTIPYLLKTFLDPSRGQPCKARPAAARPRTTQHIDNLITWIRRIFTMMNEPLRNILRMEAFLDLDLVIYKKINRVRQSSRSQEDKDAIIEELEKILDDLNSIQ
jgi:hypothetical protein